MKLNDYLASLGRTQDEVAASLRRQGIKGKVRCPRHCIILNAIYANCAESVWPGLTISGGYTHPTGGHYSYSATYGDAQIMDPSLPQPVVDFIGAFDMGRYPDLVASRVQETTTRTWE